MNNYKKVFLIILFPLFAFTSAHKFYVSVSNVSYSEKDKSFQITTRIFIDDFESLLLERYDLEAKLATQNESTLTDQYIEKYLRTKFQLLVDGELRPFVFLGRKYDNDVMVCYLEILDIELDGITSVTVQNELLTDLFDEQQNVVHVKVGDKKKSFVLIKQNNKGMLNL